MKHNTADYALAGTISYQVVEVICDSKRRLAVSFHVPQFSDITVLSSQLSQYNAPVIRFTVISVDTHQSYQ